MLEVGDLVKIKSYYFTVQVDKRVWYWKKGLVGLVVSVDSLFANILWAGDSNKIVTMNPKILEKI